MRTEYLLSGKIVCMSCGSQVPGEESENSVGTVYHYYVDSGYKNYRACDSLNIPKNSAGDVIGIEDFVLSEIEKMLDSNRYVERFKDYLKDALISLERETDTVYPEETD